MDAVPPAAHLRDGVLIRPAVATDAAAVLEVWREAETHATVTDTLAAVTLLIADAPEALLVAVAGEALVGTVIATWNGWRGSIYRLAVLPGWRRRGLARALVAEGVRRLLERGARRIDAFVVAADPVAMAFWTRMAASRWVPDPLPKARFILIPGQPAP